LLGFVALNPTYILPVLLRNAKPNNGRFRNRAPKVSISIKLAVFLASGAAYMRFGYCNLEFICNLVLVICYFQFIRVGI
jgi:uncharacterized membrane protein YqaE (UPF0057 family)